MLPTPLPTAPTRVLLSELEASLVSSASLAYAAPSAASSAENLHQVLTSDSFAVIVLDDSEVSGFDGLL